MSSTVNKVLLIGYLGNDPKIISNENNENKIASFSLATSESWKDKFTEEKKTKTEWHTILVTDQNLVNIVEKIAKKGSKVYLEGKLQTQKWIDKDNKDHYTTKVVITKYNGVIKFLDLQKKSEEVQIVEDEIPF